MLVKVTWCLTGSADLGSYRCFVSRTLVSVLWSISILKSLLVNLLKK